jgi:uncharacterized membrane protein YkvI
MKNAFLNVFGLVLVIIAISGVIQSLVFIAAIVSQDRNQGLAFWSIYAASNVILAVAAVLSLRAARHAPSSRKWGTALAGGLLGLLAAGLLKAGLTALMIGGA